MYKDPFEEYLRAQEPDRKQLGYQGKAIWILYGYGRRAKVHLLWR